MVRVAKAIDIALEPGVREDALRGNPDAQNRLGVLYISGKDVPQDVPQAASWFRQAADQGYVDAQYNLAALLDQGAAGETRPSGDQDLAQAVLWYRAAAQQNHPDAQYGLARLYDVGRGVAADAQAALAWYRQAADLGHAGAQFILGTRYDAGQGIQQDHQKAFGFYKRAAESGHARAQFNLGSMYLAGHGVAIDLVRAHKWFSLAATAAMPELGDQPARHRLLAASRMGANQMEQAARLAEQWQPRCNPETGRLTPET